MTALRLTVVSMTATRGAGRGLTRPPCSPGFTVAAGRAACRVTVTVPMAVTGTVALPVSVAAVEGVGEMGLRMGGGKHYRA